MENIPVLMNLEDLSKIPKYELAMWANIWKLLDDFLNHPALDRYN